MVNYEIQSKKVRLILEDGNKILSTRDAIHMAETEGLDLICISTSGDIPVVKIGDYKKFCYEKKKAEKEAKKKFEYLVMHLRIKLGEN